MKRELEDSSRYLGQADDWKAWLRLVSPGRILLFYTFLSTVCGIGTAETALPGYCGRDRVKTLKEDISQFLVCPGTGCGFRSLGQNHSNDVFGTLGNNRLRILPIVRKSVKNQCLIRNRMEPVPHRLPPVRGGLYPGQSGARDQWRVRSGLGEDALCVNRVYH